MWWCLARDLTGDIEPLRWPIIVERARCGSRRDHNHSTRLEEVLKTRELTCVHSEGILASELEQSPLALVDGRENARHRGHSSRSRVLKMHERSAASARRWKANNNLQIGQSGDRGQRLTVHPDSTRTGIVGNRPASGRIAQT